VGPPSDNVALAASVAIPAAFSAVFNRHFEVVHGYVRKRVGASLADDLAAQTFLIAFDRRGSYDLERPSAQPGCSGSRPT
jgi:RNA polymerase sigma-70 factor (ECF subfamily)